jgi:hypothetical protein
VAPDSGDSLFALFHSELRFRRAFIPGRFQVAERELCLLVVVHPAGHKFVVDAEAVYVKADEPGAGVGLALVGLTPGKLLDLEMFVGQAMTTSEDSSAASEGNAGMDTNEQNADSDDFDLEPEPSPPDDSPLALNAYERVRKLGSRERERAARQGQLSDRLALERVYGSAVWEGLLQNPMLTPPEVAQIAKKGTLPQPLVAMIVANNGWLASGEVRRALLGNPRVSGNQLDRVLRATPKSELKQIASVSPYRSQVRVAAKKLIDE